MPGETERAAKLRAMLEKSPGDTFLLYAMAMESRKAGDLPQALEYLDKTIQHDWGYCYAYFQKGLILAESGDRAGAMAVYKQGIEAAAKKGDAHARDEIAGALSQLE